MVRDRVRDGFRVRVTANVRGNVRVRGGLSFIFYHPNLLEKL